MDIQLRKNEEHHGLELVFSKKPNADILAQVKEHGFRWHNQKKLWFAKETDARRQFAEKLAGSTPNTVVEARDNEPVKDWYLGAYPSDTEIGHGLSDTVTFAEVYAAIEKGEDVYTVLGGVADSVVRERVFKHLSEMKGVEYDVIYNMWLGPENQPSISSESSKKAKVVFEKTAEQISGPKAKKAPVAEKKPNTFAAHYDSIGDAKIMDSDDVSLRSFTGAYFKDLLCSFSRTYSGDCMTFTDLANAGKAGKTCKVWRLYAGNHRDGVYTALHNNENIRTCKELYEALQAGRKFEGINVSESEIKAMDVFSPFLEVKPLKAVPDKWTKRNFAQALMSGQIFRGEVAYHYTDDYAMDAAYNFDIGVGLNMPLFARNAIEDWGSLSYARTDSGEQNKDGSWSLSYSEHSNSCKNLWFDVNCDIAEGKRRAEERQAGLQRFNKMMESSCINIDADSVDRLKLYSVRRLDRSSNDGRYATKQENMPGHVLRGRVEEGYMFDVLSVTPVEIQPDKLYEVSNFFQRPDSELLKDERVIDCGNWKSIVFGKALQELIAEERRLPQITESKGEYGTPERAEATLQSLADGKSRYFSQNASNYDVSLDRLRSEYQRAATRKPDLDAVMKDAAGRVGSSADNRTGKILTFHR